MTMPTAPENPVSRAYRRYTFRLLAVLGVYIAILCGRNLLLHGPMQHAPKGWQLTVAVLPVLPVIAIFVAVLQLLKSVDELCRRICVDSLAIAGGATALLAATYGFIEGDDFPRLSIWWTWTVFMGTWLIASFFVRRSYQR